MSYAPSGFSLCIFCKLVLLQTNSETLFPSPISGMPPTNNEPRQTFTDPLVESTPTPALPGPLRCFDEGKVQSVGHGRYADKKLLLQRKGFDANRTSLVRSVFIFVVQIRNLTQALVRTWNWSREPGDKLSLNQNATKGAPPTLSGKVGSHGLAPKSTITLELHPRL